MSVSEKILGYSKKSNIDECETTRINKRIITVRITDSGIAEIKQNFDASFGVRLIHDKKITSLQTTSEEGIEQKMLHALETSSHLKSTEFAGCSHDDGSMLPHKITYTKTKGTFDERLEQISVSKCTDIAQDMINSASNSKVDTITGSLNIVSEDFELKNSNGLDFNEKATYISGIINAESQCGKTPVSGIGHACGRTLSNFSPKQIGCDAKTMCIESINPQKIDTDTYSIIFEPYSVGELLAFVAASNFNFKTFSEKKSCFSNDFEKTIAVEQLNLVDDPHIPEGIGTKQVDDEGVKTEKTDLIQGGVFKNTFSNIADSCKEGKRSTGNALRPNFLPMGRSSDPITISAPHNLKITQGDYTQEEMIKETKHGLLVGRLWYTYAVNPIRGDFSCTARSGIRIIENGQITSPGKSVRIIHSFPNMLKNISAIGDNQKSVMQWASLPSVTPSLQIQNITVSSI